MADSSIVAFGRYLKIVRERRKLSLEDVAHLTKAYPEPVNKGYLSRVERGINHVGFSKMVALSRAYEVPLDAFGERYALDLEVERLRNAPETAGKSVGELLDAAARYSSLGRRVHGFACVRDAMARAHLPPVMPNYSSQAEQLAAVTLAHGTYAVGISRYRLGAAEVAAADEMHALRTEFQPIVSYELSLLHRAHGDLAQSRRYADRAIEEALATEKQKYLGDAYAARAHVASLDNDSKLAVQLFAESMRAKRRAGKHAECVVTLLGLADHYIQNKRLGAARRSIQAARRLESEFGTSRAARIELLLGEIELAEGRKERAAQHWHRSVEAAKESSDRGNQFRAEFHLFRLAVEAGNTIVLNALGRRLTRLAQTMPPGEKEVVEFRALYTAHRRPKQRSVARVQLERPTQSTR